MGKKPHHSLGKVSELPNRNKSASTADTANKKPRYSFNYISQLGNPRPLLDDFDPLDGFQLDPTDKPKSKLWTSSLRKVGRTTQDHHSHWGNHENENEEDEDEEEDEEEEEENDRENYQTPDHDQHQHIYKKRKLSYKGDIALDGRKYKSKVVSRKQLHTQDSHDELSDSSSVSNIKDDELHPFSHRNDDSLDEDSDHDHTAGHSDFEQDNWITGSSNLDLEQKSSDSDAKGDTLQNELDTLQKEEEKAAQLLKQQADSDQKKATALVEQLTTFDILMNQRISMQNVLHDINRIPRPKDYVDFCKRSDQVSNLMRECSGHMTSSIRHLLDIQNQLLEYGDAFQLNRGDGDGSQTEQDNQIGDGEARGQDKELVQLWKQIQRSTYAMEDWKRHVLEKWSRQAKDASGGAASQATRFKALDQSALSQIESVLADKERLCQKMHLVRNPMHVFGMDKSKKIVMEVDEEHFDDTDFYQQLLRDVIRSGQGMSRFAQLLQRSKARARKTVDRRASKARVLRYNVHDKLVGFLNPVPIDDPPYISELVKGLFGRR